MKFDEWMREVDSHVGSLVMLSVHDLPDAPWWDYWHDGLEPADAVTAAVDDGYLADIAPFV